MPSTASSTVAATAAISETFSASMVVGRPNTELSASGSERRSATSGAVRKPSISAEASSKGHGVVRLECMPRMAAGPFRRLLLEQGSHLARNSRPITTDQERSRSQAVLAQLLLTVAEQVAHEGDCAGTVAHGARNRDRVHDRSPDERHARRVREPGLRVVLRLARIAEIDLLRQRQVGQL